MDFDLYLLGLPLVASVIGYSTNWIAIRMLFRPLEEKKIFGHRIPFTPGLIPKRKSDIAENIGRAVGEHLLTPDALEERLSSPEVKEELKRSLEDWMVRFLEEERGTIREMIPEGARSDMDALADDLAGKIKNGLGQLVSEKELERFVRELIESGLDDLSERKLGEIVDRWSYEEIALELEKILSGLAENEDIEENVRDFWRTRLSEFKDNGGSLGEYLGEEITGLIFRQVEINLPVVLKKGAELLDRPGLRSRIEEVIVEILDEKIHGEFDEDSVWDQVKLGFLETLVLPRERLKEKVEELIEDGIPKLIELLEREEFREEITGSAIESLEKVFHKDLSELGWSDEGVDRLAETLTNLSLTLIGNERAQSLVLEGLILVIKNSEHRKVGELVELEKEDEREALVRAISGYIVDSLRSEAVREKLGAAVKKKMRDLQGKEVGKLSHWVDPDLITPFAGPVVDQLTVVVAHEGSDILNALDVKELVKGEVEEFSTLRVERLVLDVTGNQFRAITWFGALIGFLIGILQILIIIIGG